MRDRDEVLGDVEVRKALGHGERVGLGQRSQAHACGFRGAGLVEKPRVESVVRLGLG
ncbi:hypothetical protein [Chenggangzhangella methanolivorans]|uniref:Uncharacterized protein n=1 Tax=Chenggangzhangella methanolivorans TaxID=1437009 RepID=A0A9E6UK69_9HYPH|nr:hypothetical protein [Chenggangzhangella methanolivorans]QZN98906.1 hypothetical protein K6K41_18580 [Chenggangzhangella methanolivorans]